MGYFDDFNFSDFGFDADSKNKQTITEKDIKNVETALGYKLPNSYVELVKIYNGGFVNKDCFPTQTRTSWSEDHISISSIMGIGGEYDIVKETRLMVDEWQYPDIGVVVCDCPTAGHHIVMLDYRECGKDGEPKVAYVDQEWDYTITILADNFEQFIKGLVLEEFGDEIVNIDNVELILSPELQD